MLTSHRVSAVSFGITYRLLPAVLLLCLFPAFGKAAVQVVNVDVNGFSTNTYTGEGAYTTPDAHLWNGFDLLGTVYFPGGGSPLSSGPLVNSAGGATSVQVTLGGIWRTFNFTTYGGGSLATGNALLDDVIYIDNADNGNDGLFHTSFTISGLTPGSAYSIVAYGTSGTDMVATDFRVNGIVQTTTGRNSPTSPAIFTEGADYTAFSSVLADGSGMITGYFKAHTTPNGRLSGLQIINGPVPEPASFAVVGSIGFLFIARRYR